MSDRPKPEDVVAARATHRAELTAAFGSAHQEWSDLASLLEVLERRLSAIEVGTVEWEHGSATVERLRRQEAGARALLKAVEEALTASGYRPSGSAVDPRESYFKLRRKWV
jgi:hypothetical protein